MAETLNLTAKKLLLLRVPEENEQTFDVASRLAERTGLPVVVLTPGYDLSALDDEAMARHGWVRKES